MHPKLSKTLSKYSKIILVGGGTGGHVQPIVSILSSLRKELSEGNEDGGLVREFLWIGGKSSQEEQAAQENHVEFVTIPTFKLSTTRSPKIALYPFVLLRGIWEARRILYSVIAREKVNPNEMRREVPLEGEAIQKPGSPHSVIAPFAMTESVAVFSKGGPGSVAVGIAAWSLGIPLYIHESDTIPGRSNRILGNIATRIFLGFDSAKKYFDPTKCEVIGQILAGVFLNQDSKNQTFQHSISWKTNKKHLLIICGSQGARAIFEEILKNLETILHDHEIILILGKLNTDMRKDFETIIKDSKTPRLQDSIQLLDWISQEDLAHLIPGTDIAITRGSATTLAELTAFSSSNTPSLHHSNTPTLHHSNTPTLIIIPLPYAADNHQYWNAREYEKLGHILIEQKNIHLLTETLKKIGQNSPRSNI